MHKLITTAIVMALSLAVPTDATELVGAIVPPSPNGLDSHMGTCLPMGDDFCAYSIATLNEPEGTVTAVLGKKLVEYVDDLPVWEIIASIDAPRQSTGQFWALEECYVGEVQDPSVIALVTAIDMGGWLETEDTVWAVRFDVPTNQLMQLDPTQVKCVLPGS